MRYFIRLMYKKIGMVIFRWKDYKMFQIDRTVMKLGYQEVQRINVKNVLDVRCPNDMMEFQKIWMMCIEATII